MEIPGGWGGPPTTLWNGNSRGVGGFKLKNHPWGGYGYFLESHNMKYVVEGTNAAKNSGYFPACSAVVMLKIEARLVCTRMRCCSNE